MTPRERVEAVARAAWGVDRVTASTYPQGRGVIAFATEARTSTDVPRSAHAWGADHDAAFARLECFIVGEAAHDTATRARYAVEAQVAAQNTRRVMLAIACAVPCRGDGARCRAPSLCVWERCPRVLPHLSPYATQMRPAAHPSRWVIAALRAQGQTSDALQCPALRPLWWRRGSKGRACRDPRKHAPTCKVMP